MTTNDPKQHLRFHNLSILQISQSYSVLSKTDQLLDHPLGYFYKADLGAGLNLPEQGGCTNSTNLQEVLRFMSYRFYVGMIVLKRRNEESDGSISRKRNVQSERESRLMEFVDLFYAFQTK